MPPWLRFVPVLALAGCATGEDPGAAMQAALDSNRASLGAIQPQPLRPVPAQSAPAPAAPVTASAPIAATTQPTPSSIGGGAPDTAAALIGADPDTVLRILGPPRLRRSEGTSEIWLYAGPDCHLDLVLYAEAEGARVAHAQARADGAIPRTETECLAGIAQRGV
ncbi:hypothetical protein [Plastoroseomonas arctica]|uniref:Uncharacterized protein n=1 Tax=Plastoroseomonas arctica TaxID=1509237 RepID=A0AAF1JXM6_9PROT|nr:hypothetical protein [Plastoroseomonas arctica]MBR0656341.1 hypothetical protein [Plastoroseomonas arctica]